MLETLKFVRGAAARKDFSPALTHFKIADGKIRAYDGRISLCSPIALDLNVSPLAEPFYRALMSCESEDTALYMTKAGRLAVKSGKFRAYIQCHQEEFPVVEPEGVRREIPEPLLPHLQRLTPFVSDDASRPWSRGILANGGTLTATNNVVIVQSWVGKTFDRPVNIPLKAIKELLRIKQEPTHVWLAEQSITFEFENGRWLRSQLLDTAWPDIDRILDVPSNPAPLPTGFAEALEKLKPFLMLEGRVYLNDGSISTHPVEDEEGATVEVPGTPAGALFHFDHLTLAVSILETIDLSAYPRPCLFYNPAGIRGAIVGMR